MSITPAEMRAWVYQQRATYARAKTVADAVVLPTPRADVVEPSAVPVTSPPAAAPLPTPALRKPPAESTATKRAYTIKDVCRVLAIPKRSFYENRRRGYMPFLQELKPRMGRIVRYRADLVDRYAAGEWGQPRSFMSHRRIA